jgi:hypothetical protein
MSASASSHALPGLSVIEQTPIIIEKILWSASDDLMQWKPSAERWSIGEVLAHLADVEVVFRARVQKMLDENNPKIESYDQNVSYASGKYAGKARENLKLFCHERDRTLSWLRYVPAAMTERTAQHAELGTISVGHMMNEWSFHDLGHIRQILELYRSRAFYPQMGPFQKYSTVRP